LKRRRSRPPKNYRRIAERKSTAMRNIYQFSVLPLTGFSLISHGLSTDCRAIGRKWGFFVTSDPYQAYPSYPTGAPWQLVEEPAVQLVAAGPLKQRRLTVAFRAILIIPHAFVLSFLNLAGFVVAFLGWWGALFMGRLPEFAVTYLSGLIRWNARVYGYSFLLTDDYPPFKFEDDLAYPVVIAIPPPGRLNRFAVFFRFILAIWAHLVLSLVTGAANVIVVFIAWLILLITGKLPAPLHLAFTAVLRFQTRYYCYMGMLTSTYPSRLFGDEPAAWAPVTAAPAEPAAPAEWAAPTDGAPADGAAPTVTMPWAQTATPVESAWGAPPPAYGTTPGFGTTPGYASFESVYGTPGGYGSAQPSYQPAHWPLVLPRSAKILLIVFIVLGLVNVIGTPIYDGVTGQTAADSLSVRGIAISQWNSDSATLKTNMGRNPTNACGQNLDCLIKADSLAAMYFSTFATEVQAITMPSAAASDATTVVTDATQVSQDFTQLSSVSDISQYQSTYSGTGLAQELQTFQQDESTLASALNNS
jgi:hypothetical protein